MLRSRVAISEVFTSFGCTVANASRGDVGRDDTGSRITERIEGRLTLEDAAF